MKNYDKISNDLMVEINNNLKLIHSTILMIHRDLMSYREFLTFNPKGEKDEKI